MALGPAWLLRRLKPNNWSRDETFQNVLRKIDAGEVEGSNWDPDSVMESWFRAGLIVQPAEYHDGVNPAGGLSETDKQWVKRFYPALPAVFPTLEPFRTRKLSLKSGEQADFN